MRHFQHSIGYITDPGNKRAGNEDSLIVKLGSLDESMFALLAVADGMGGLEKGHLASGCAVSALEQWWNGTLPGFLQPDPDWEGAVGSLSVLPEAIHWQIKALGGGPSGSTLSMAFLQNEHATIFHVGDSRVYLIRDGCCRQITQDQTWCQEAVDAGTLTAEAARVHPMRHVLTSTLGAGERFRLERQDIALQEHDMLLLCSDGFYGELDIEGACRSWRKKDPVQNILETAMAAIKAGEAGDNLTALLLRLGKKGRNWA